MTSADAGVHPDAMQWQHYNRIKASMDYIERLLRDVEKSIDGEYFIYKKVKNDLNDEQRRKIKNHISETYIVLEDARGYFNLEPNSPFLSKIIHVNCGLIWETLEDMWSFKMEKTSGAIRSKRQKERLDNFINKILKHTNDIERIIGK